LGEVACTAYHDPIGRDELKMLQQVQDSPKWPEWEKAIHAELDQLTHIGTWWLTDKPPTTVPIANKWVFAKKYNKSGELVKYKA
jgi:hypothetical protein